MDPNILTTLGSMLAVLAGMLGITAYLRSDLKEVKDDLKEDIKEVKDDLKEDIQGVDTDIRRVDDRVWQLSNTIIQHHLGVSPDDLPDVPEPERPARDREKN